MNTNRFTKALRGLLRRKNPEEETGEERPMLLESLEPRILYSAAPVAEAPAPEAEEPATEDVTVEESGATANALAAPELVDNLLSADDALSDAEAQALVESLAQSAVQI